jgi:anti-sigma B factor antagonist
MQPTIRVSFADDVAVLHVVDDLDMANAPEVRSRALTAIDDGWSTLVIDLTGCDFIDSVGLGTLVAILRRARSRGGDVSVVAPFEPQRRLFELCGLDAVFDLRSEPLPETA